MKFYYVLKNIFPKVYLKAQRMANISFLRDENIKEILSNIPNNRKILDAGCGSQKYKSNCSHLKYFSQDFGLYTKPKNESISDDQLADSYNYGKLDFVGDIWDIEVPDNTFDYILCTEVFEHIPYPNETFKEFKRIVKKGGEIIVSFPASSIRHYDPYYFYSGFSDNYINFFCEKHQFELKKIHSLGGYYSYMFAETFRSFLDAKNIFKLFLIPSLFYFFFKKENKKSLNTLNQGYIFIAKKL